MSLCQYRDEKIAKYKANPEIMKFLAEIKTEADFYEKKCGATEE
jgi:hypothetical protein